MRRVRFRSSVSQLCSTFSGKSHKPPILRSSCRFDNPLIISELELVAPRLSRAADEMEMAFSARTCKAPPQIHFCL